MDKLKVIHTIFLTAANLRVVRVDIQDIHGGQSRHFGKKTFFFGTTYQILRLILRQNLRGLTSK